MSNLISFNYQDKQVRVIEKDGEPWFVAKDVFEILDITWKGYQSLSQIPKDWIGVIKLVTPGGEQELITISEPALYKLALRYRAK